MYMVLNDEDFEWTCFKSITVETFSFSGLETFFFKWVEALFPASHSFSHLLSMAVNLY